MAQVGMTAVQLSSGSSSTNALLIALSKGAGGSANVHQLEIDNSIGDCLHLIHNSSATNYTQFILRSTGRLDINVNGGLQQLNIYNHNGSTSGLALNSILVTANANEINTLTGVVAGNASANNALVIDSDKNIAGINNISANNIIVNGTLVTASAVDLNYTDILTAGMAQPMKSMVTDVNVNIAGINTLSAVSFYGTLFTTDQPNITTLGTLNSLSMTGNLTVDGAVLTSNMNELNVLHGVTGGTAIASSALVLDSSSNIVGINSLSATSLTGTLLTNAQPNITSVGTLTSLSISGVLTLGSVALTSTAAELNLLHGVTGGTAVASKAVVLNSSGGITSGLVALAGLTSVSSTNFTGTLSTPAQANITSVGTLTSLLVENSSTTGNLTTLSSNNTTNNNYTLVIKSSASTGNCLQLSNTNSASKNVKFLVDTSGNLIITPDGTTITLSGNVNGINTLTATTVSGTLSTATQPNITLVGTLTSLALSGAISGVTTLTATALTGTLSTAAQPNITSVGILTSLSVSGTLTFGGVVVTSNSTQLNYVNVTPGTASPSLALVLDGSRNISNINNIISTGTNTNTGTIINTTGTSNVVCITAYSPNLANGNSTYIKLGVSATNNNEADIAFYYTGDGSVSNSLGFGFYGVSPILSITCNGNVNITSHNGSTIGLQLNGTLVTSTATQLNYVNVTPGSASASKALILNSSSSITGINNLSATTLAGTLSTAAQPNITSVGTLTSLALSGALTGITSLTTNVLVLGSTTLTSTATELNVLHGVTPGTASVSLGLVLDSNKNISGINSLSATSLTGTLQTIAQPNITSVGTLTSLALSGAISGVTALTATNIAGLLTSPAQTNITSTGILTSLSVSGALTLGGALLTSTTSELNLIHGVTPGTAIAGIALVTDSNNNIVGINSISSSSYSGIIMTAAQTNITSVGTLTGLTLSGAISGVTTLTATTLAGTLSTAAQTNITSVGTLTSLSVSGTLTLGGTAITATAANINVLAGVTAGTGTASKALVLNSSSGITTGLTTLSGLTTVSATTLTGTLSTAAQTSITSVGTLTSLALSGAITGLSQILLGTSTDTTRTISALNSSMATLSRSYITIGQTNTLNNQAEISFYYAGSGLASNSMGFGLYGGTAMTILGSGYVGIGTVTPSYMLDVIGTSKTTNLILAGTITGVTSITTAALTLGSTLVTSTAAELNVLAGVTAGTGAASKALVLNSSSGITTGLTTLSGLTTVSATTLTGTLSTAAQANITSVGTLTSLALSGAITGATSISTAALTLGGTTITATAANINVLAGVTAGTGSASKALVLNASNGITTGLTTLSGLTSISTTNLTVNGVAITGSGGTPTYLTNITPGTATASNALVVDSNRSITNINALTTTGTVTAQYVNASQIGASSVGIGLYQINGNVNMGTYTDGTWGGIGSWNASPFSLYWGYSVYNQALTVSGTTGSIGIGTTTPSYLLDVSYLNSPLPGFFGWYLSGGYGGSGTSYSSVNISARFQGRILVAGEIDIYSDRRIKTDIYDLSEDFCKSFIQKTTPVHFKYNNKVDDQSHYGYIAQDVIKAGFTELVTLHPHEGMEETTDDDGFVSPKDAVFTLCLDEVVPILSKNIKMLHKENEVLKQKNTDLMLLINKLSDCLDKLEKK